MSPAPQDFDPRWIGPLGWMHAACFGVLLPLAVVRGRRKLVERKTLPPRRTYFANVLVQQLAFAAFSLWVAHEEWIELFPRRTPRLLDVALGLVVLAAFVAFMAPRWKRNVERRVKRLWLVMPRDGVERALWVCVSLAAGIGEELVYRGVLFTVLTRATDSALVSAGLCTVAFSVAHWTQGRSSVLVIAGFAALFHVLVWTTGNLYVAMAVHVAYDLAAGFGYAYWGKRLGYPGTDAEFVALPADAPFSTD